MSQKIKNIDLNLMSFPMSQVQSEDFKSNNLNLAINKFNELMKDGKKKYEFEVENSNQIHSLSELEIDSAKKIDSLTQLADVIENNSKSIHLFSKNKLTIQIRSEFLRKTSISFENINNKLHIDLVVSDENVRAWLSKKIFWLTNEVGKKIKNPLVVRLIDPERPDEICGVCESNSKGSD